MPHTYSPEVPGATAVTIAQAAARLGVSASTVRRMIADGDLPTVLIGQRLVRIPVTALDAYLAHLARAKRANGRRGSATR